MVFTSNSTGIWLFNNSKNLVQVPSTARFPASYTYSYLFSAKGLLGGVSGSKIVLDTGDSSTSSFTLPAAPTRFYYDDANDQSYVYDAEHGNRYGDGIYAGTYLQKVDGEDLLINSTGEHNGKKVMCTATGMYNIEMYVNKKISAGAVVEKRKNNGIVSLNNGRGSMFSVIYNKDSNGLLGIVKYSLNDGTEEEV